MSSAAEGRTPETAENGPRVLLVADRTGPRGGGVGTVVSMLCRELPAVGIRPAVFTATPEPGDEETPESFGVPVRRTRLGRPGLRPREIAGFVRQYPAARRAFREAIREFRPDVLNVHFLNSGGAWLAARRGNRGGVPVVASAHGRDVGTMAETLPGARIARRILRAATVATACSASLLDDVRRHAGDRLPALRVIHNGVSIDDFEGARDRPPPVPAPYLLGVGELHAKKGFDLLFRAFRELAQTDPELHLLIAGEGGERENLLREADTAGLAARVHLPGHVPAADLPPYYAHAEAFVLASRSEPFGIVALEAMAAGAPVVAARVGGVPEFVTDGVNGRLFPVDDTSALEATLRDLRGNPDQAADLVEAGRRTAERMSWRRTAEAYRDVYLEALR